MGKTNGVILYKGKSRFDKGEIVVIATMKSNNTKTGNIIQTWILNEDHNPLEAIELGYNSSVCGDCKHRRNVGGACYVNVGQAPMGVYRAYKRGIYPTYNHDKHAELFKNRVIRLGAYGDPAMVPIDVWKPILELTKAHTGYTHMWDKAPDYKGYCVASVDSAKEMNTAANSGWQTFRIKMPNEPEIIDEIICPATIKEGITCEKCKICNGSFAKNVVINVHGSLKSRFGAT